MQNETPFKGSSLETEIRNTFDCEKLKKKHGLIKAAIEIQPNSIFWKEAIEMIDEKYNKCK